VLGIISLFKIISFKLINTNGVIVIRIKYRLVANLIFLIKNNKIAKNAKNLSKELSEPSFMIKLKKKIK
jgi:hypothetical protein